MSKQISMDNGHSYYYVEEIDEAVAEIDERNLWDVVVAAMEDDAREEAHRLTPCTEAEFLARYLEVAENDLVIG